jgi:AraC-like DNA-binding protein
MRTKSASAPAEISANIVIGDADPLPRQPTFRTCHLDQASEYMRGILVEHKVDYLSPEHHLDYFHRQAKLGAVGVNLMQFGPGVIVNATPFTHFYMLQFTLSGWCEICQDKRSVVLPTGSVAVMSPFRPFAKAWMPGSRQLFLKIDKRLVERKFRAWTGNEEAMPLEFDLTPITDIARIGTLTRYVRMLCDDLKNDGAHLAHPLVHEQIAGGLISLLLTSLPHNKMRAIEAAGSPAAPRFIRRVEEFIQEHACEPLTLEDLATVAGVSTRASKLGFRRFRDTTPMAYLRATRLEVARRELVRAVRYDASVATVANAVGFAHLGRFARDYKARFGEAPSRALSRGSARPGWQDGDD